MKQSYLQVRISQQEKAELSEIVSRQPGDVTMSQFVRDAFREKLAALKETENASVAAQPSRAESN